MTLSHPKPINPTDFPDRVVVGANGAYWRDYGDHYSMCPVSTDNDPVEPVAIYNRQEADARAWDRGFAAGLAARAEPRAEGLGHCPCTCCSGRWEIVSATLRCNGGCGCTAGPRIAPIPHEYAAFVTEPDRVPA